MLPIDPKTDVAGLIALGTSFSQPKPNPHPGGRAFVVVPESGGGMKVEYLERPDLPPRKTGSIQVHDAESLITYALKHKQEGTMIYATLAPATITAVFNDHQLAEANWADHRANFGMTMSDEYAKEWVANNRKSMSQTDFAEFIERNLPDFQEPTGASMYELALNFRAKQEASYSGAIRTQSGDIELTYTAKTNDTGAGVAGKMKVPERFTISIPVWSGLRQTKYAFSARLRYRLGNGSVAFYYELDRPHKVVEQAFDDVLAKVREKVSVPIIFGHRG